MATALTQTTLSAALTATATQITVASATGISAPTAGFMQKLYILDAGTQRGELVTVTSVSGTVIGISRLDEYKSAHLSGALVIIAPIDPTFQAFQARDPQGVPAANSELTQYTPLINVTNGNMWVVGTNTAWAPYFNNPAVASNATPTLAVASAAGQVTPTGPLFHITGTAAITGFLLPVGFTSGQFTVIPDAIFTWTAANNIALAGTAVVNKALTFTYDPVAAKWIPSYIA